MMAFLLSIFPMKALLGILGCGAGLAAIFVKSKVSAVENQDAKVEVAKAIEENHAVEQKEAAAKTPEDVYAALDADRASDLK